MEYLNVYGAKLPTIKGSTTEPPENYTRRDIKNHNLQVMAEYISFYSKGLKNQAMGVPGFKDFNEEIHAEAMSLLFATNQLPKFMLEKEDEDIDLSYLEEKLTPEEIQYLKDHRDEVLRILDKQAVENEKSK